MSINITDDGASIKLDINPAYQREGYNNIPVQTSFIQKGDLEIKAEGNDIYLSDGQNKYRFLYSDITSPDPNVYNSAVLMAARIETFLDSNSGLSTSDNFIGLVGSGASEHRVSITRPANTTAYASGDVMNTDSVLAPLSFTVSRKNDKNCWAVGGVAISSVAAATLPQIDLMLFKASFGVEVDNSPFDPSDAELKDYYLGTISFNQFKALANNASSDGDVVRPHLLTPAASTQVVYAVPVLRNAYTPASGEVVTFVIYTMHN
jgi:hypothetical protein